MTSVQLNEASSKDWVIGIGYRINDFNLFNNGTRRVAKSKKKKTSDSSQQDNSSSRQSSGLNRDLNLRLDMSYRQQASLTRDIASLTSAASSGNTAFQILFLERLHLKPLGYCQSLLRLTD